MIEIVFFYFHLLLSRDVRYLMSVIQPLVNPVFLVFDIFFFFHADPVPIYDVNPLDLSSPNCFTSRHIVQVMEHN